MSKATAKAFSNIALVKYWGKGDEQLRLPVNSSAAVGLDGIYTLTTVEFSADYAEDEVEIDGETFANEEKQRVSRHLDLIRHQAGLEQRARVVTKNNFPKAVGAASSASGFAALTVAAAAAADLQLSEKELSLIARQGSGSATRSVTGGLSIWHAGTSSETSFAERIEYPPDWDLRVLLLFVGDVKAKKVSSSKGMSLASTSPYFQTAIAEAEANIKRLQQALTDRSWTALGKVIEDECYRLHMLCQTSSPNILYWEGTTVDIFQKLYELRAAGIEAFFTVDAGPHVHVICQQSDVAAVKSALQTLVGISNVVECGIAGPATVIEEHLF